MERQDLPYANHLPSELKLSPVESLFQNRSVFITGATGFIGRVLLEKILRCYPGIHRIYILLRIKKGQLPNNRLHTHVLGVPIFDKIKANEELIRKLVVVPGDISMPQLGISNQDLQMMLSDSNLSIVFHLAANTRFNEPLKLMIQQNIVATREVIRISKQLTNLLALCHVSSTFANCHLNEGQDIEERLYPIGRQAEEVIKMAECLDQQLLEKLRVDLVAERPNTYTYTKALAEHLIFDLAKGMPVVIVRPSTVLGAWQEPLPGWVDNINGPTGMILAIGKGLVRTYHAVANAKADIVPVDLVVNTMISAAYYISTTAHPKGSRDDLNNNDEPVKPIIFHCNSGDLNPMTWSRLESLQSILRDITFAPALRYPAVSIKSNKYHDIIVRLFAHYLPALIIDLICVVTGRKRELVRTYRKIHGAMDALEHFATSSFNFKTNNLKLLKAALEDDRDGQILWLDITTLDWDVYWFNIAKGIRRYILKEPDETLPEARKSLAKTRYIEMSLKLVLYFSVVYFVLYLSGKYI